MLIWILACNGGDGGLLGGGGGDDNGGGGNDGPALADVPDAIAYLNSDDEGRY